MLPSKPWFRIHNTIVDNPKIQRMPDNLVRPWLNLVAIANGNGGVLPGIADVAFRMRLSETKCETLIETFLERRLFDHTDDGIAPHDWNDWQYQSDVSTGRVKQFRERQRNVSGNVSETADETDQRQSRDRADLSEAKASSGGKPPKSPKGIRLAPDWKPSPEDRAYALGRNLSPVEIDLIAEQFSEYWRSADCPKPLKKDWPATWRRWVSRCATETIGRRVRSGTASPRSASPTAARDSILAKAGIQRRGDSHGLPADVPNGTAGIAGSRGNHGTIIDADDWRDVSGPANGAEGADTAEPGDHGGPGSADGRLPQAADGLPSGCDALRADDAAGLQPLVAGMGGVEGSAGDVHCSAPHDAGGVDHSLDIPAFLRRTA